MKLHSFKEKQSLSISIEEAWKFFSDPRNLSLITPKSLNLKINSTQEISQMFPGQIITYLVKPFYGFSFSWVTEITHVDSPKYFVDEQRFGPFKFWHHQHHLNSVAQGVIMEDIIHYALPGDPFSRIVHPLIRKKLIDIFSHRKIELNKRFNEND
ncbi:MAG: SRPBCC family protein [bacterium]|nr:SRPBCC family protein [bacterium]